MGQTYKPAIKRVLCMLLVCLILAALPLAALAAVEDVTYSIPVTQTFTCSIDDTALERTFQYSLRALTEGAPMPAEASEGTYLFTLTGDQTLSIGPLTCSRAGEYTYQIKQLVTDPKDGYIYDLEEYSVTVLVKNTETGLEAELLLPLTSAGEKSNNGVLFQNCYEKGYAPISVDPPFEKRVQGNPAANSRFTFLFEAKDQQNPMPKGGKDGIKEVTVIGAGSTEIGEIRFEKPGVYVYTLKEKNTKVSGYTYDETVYTYTFTVAAEQGVLKLEQRIEANGKAVSKAVFTNKYTAPGQGPKTGDESNVILYTCMAVIFFGMFIMMFLFLIRDKKEERASKKASDAASASGKTVERSEYEENN